MEQFKGTTIVSLRRDGNVALGGDGQVSLGNTIMKGNARKIRRLYNDKVIAGFAGGTADAFTLFERFETKLEQHNGQLTRAAVELAKDWRTDRMLRAASIRSRRLGHLVARRRSEITEYSAKWVAEGWASCTKPYKNPSDAMWRLRCCRRIDSTILGALSGFFARREQLERSNIQTSCRFTGSEKRAAFTFTLCSSFPDRR